MVDKKFFDSFVINIPNFRENVLNHIKILINLINTASNEEKKSIWLLSVGILDDFISRAKGDEFTIPKDANLKLIAVTIIYTVLVSNKDMPTINCSKVFEIPKDSISHYYLKHFKQLYKKVGFYENSSSLKDLNLSNLRPSFLAFWSLCAILHGDGSLKDNRIAISLNPIDEPEYFREVYKILLSIFNLPFRNNIIKFTKKRKGKGVDIIIHRTILVNSLLDYGFKLGNKVKNKISAYDLSFISKSNLDRLIIKYRLGFIRYINHLINTDGSVYPKKTTKSIIFTFKSASRPLVKSFKEIVNIFKIHTTNIMKSSDKDGNVAFHLDISRINDVLKFIEIFNPSKWKYRREYIARLLIAFRDQSSFEIMENKIRGLYPKTNRFTKEYKDFFETLYDFFSFPRDSDSIKESIRIALTNKTIDYFDLNVAEYYKILFIRLGSFLAVFNFIKSKKDNFLRIPTSANQIKNYVKRLFIRISSVNFDVWYKTNKNFLIFNDKFREFNSHSRIAICIFIYKIYQSCDFELSNNFILGKLCAFFRRNHFDRILFLLQDNATTKNIVNNYLCVLIRFIKHLILFPNERLQYTLLKTRFLLPFKTNIINSIVHSLHDCDSNFIINPSCSPSQLDNLRKRWS